MRLTHDPRFHWRDDAPNLSAEMVVVNGVTRLRVWCDHCECFHLHGPMPGHRESHCHNPASPYEQRGYNLELVGD